MKLAKALDLHGGEAVAFVGAGGKTSVMFALAKELRPPVLLTTSTHMGVWQAALADQHHSLNRPEKLQAIDFTGTQTVLLTGPQNGDNRLAGLDSLTLEHVYRFCQQRGYTLLIEADGARLKPLKAPADYEPVVPHWVDLVVVLAGLSGLGGFLEEGNVHRPEIFAQLAGLSLGDEIGVAHLAAVLGSPLGGLKGIPEGARRILLLNQAEGAAVKAQGARVAGQLTGIFDRVLVGSLQQPASDGPIFSADSRTAGIILAAGGSARLGKSKQLLNWRGKPFVAQVAQNALSAGLDPLIVVTGSDRVLVEEALADLFVRFVHNPNWESGQSTSMKAGLAAIPKRCDRVVYLLSDQPQVSPLLIRALIERHNVWRAPITAPMMGERRGNPILFGREVFEALSTLTGDKGGRGVFNQFKLDYVTWIDNRSLLDVDQVGDLEKLTRAYFKED